MMSPPERSRNALLALACFCLLPCAQVTASEELSRFRAMQPLMGSTFEIILYATDEAKAEAAMQGAFARIATLNQVFSDYETSSEANQLSRAAPMAEPVKVSADMWEVLSYAHRLSRQSDGAFDVTVGPLTRLWRRARRRGELPDQQRLADALAVVGSRHLRCDVQQQTVQLLAEDMRLDFGGIAKGYAADRALEELRAAGITHALINAGGDVSFAAAPPGETGWRVGVAPLEANQAPSRYLRLAHRAIATSGDMWQYVEIDGKRYSHIVDPRTGLGLTRRSSVTIIATNGMIADSLASAVSVLGRQEGMKLIEATCQAECLIVCIEGDDVQSYTSRGFDRFVEEDPRQD